MGDDQSILRSARVSYDLDEREVDAARDEKLLRYLLKNHHTSPFEHVTFTFHVKAPIFVARQWMRHRTWSFNEISARYTRIDDSWYTPLAWRGQAKDNKQMSAGIIENQREAQALYTASVIRALKAYRDLIYAGASREMARMVLPVSMFTRFYATVNLHNLLAFLRLRDHDHAQPEIREYAIAMGRIAVEKAPVTMEIWRELNA
jgi:thymidylate synthase (FAD)